MKTSATNAVQPEGGEKLESQKLFGAFMKEVNKPGLIDQRAKKLMAIALSISEKCRPCLVIHIKSALSMGISKDEIDEAAWLAISFCGSPAMMFYKEVLQELEG
jgi:AhpD family alkylhydroperoxidase